MGPPRLGGYRLAFLLGVPLAWAVLLWFHPASDVDDIYGTLQDHVTRWLIVHLGTLLFIGLTGAALYLLVRDLPGPAATFSRVAAGMFVLFYGAGEAILGVAVGVLVQHTNEASPGDRDGAADAIQALWHSFLSGDLFLTIGSVAWVTAVFAAAVSFRQVGAPLAVSILLALSAMVILHPPPFGPIGLICFAGAVAVLARSQRTAGIATNAAEGWA